MGCCRYTEDELAVAVAESTSIRQVLIRLGLAPAGGGSYRTLESRIRALNLSTSHFMGQGWNRGDRSGNLGARHRPLESRLVVDPDYTGHRSLKARLIATGTLQERCAICGLGPRWHGSRLVLRMDHVNGQHADNRLENLRLICPNCDSQLPTFAGRNKRRAASP